MTLSNGKDNIDRLIEKHVQEDKKNVGWHQKRSN